jgi:dihydrodipicolinate synthase/N-acetylneuraminate lyase
VVSGIGERPAVAHMSGFRLPGFTTGSGCLAPALTSQLFATCSRGAWGDAEVIRARFLPLEDQRDAWGPARVLHAALELAGVAKTGPIPPFVTALADAERAALEPVARELVRLDSVKQAAVVGPS